MAMTLSEAMSYADRALARAQTMRLAVSIAVVDEFGQLVQLDRMDGASLMSPDVALAKAVTALNFRQPTSEVAKLDAAAVESIAAAAGIKLLAQPGGMPIYRENAIFGAIGVSGSTPEEDEQLVRHAVGPAEVRA